MADLLATDAAVVHDLDGICVLLIDPIPRAHKNLSSLLNSVRGLYTYQPQRLSGNRWCATRGKNSSVSAPSYGTCSRVKHGF